MLISMISKTHIKIIRWAGIFIRTEISIKDLFASSFIVITNQTKYLLHLLYNKNNNKIIISFLIFLSAIYVNS
jgi:hypothetical protein